MMKPLPDFLINGHRLGRGSPVYCIGEIGSNHNGSYAEAEYLVRELAAAGANAVKFQAFQREDLFIPTLPEPTNETELRNAELLRKRWELLPKYTAPDDWWPKLADLCYKLGVDFLCTPFSLHALEQIAPLVPAIKIASGDITWLELLQASAQYGKPIIFSTGASDLQECQIAVDSLRSNGCEDIIALHCVSNYPPRWEQANLLAMPALGDALNTHFGLSDHSPGSVLPVAARALGACIIEKHVTRDRGQVGLDHHFAMTPEEFGKMVQDLRNLEAALGSGDKHWTADEEIERYWVRRGIFAARDIVAGCIIAREDLLVLRPCVGIEAHKLTMAAGCRANALIPKGAPITEDFCDGFV